MTQSTKIRGKFYPLQHSEWLRACQELTPSQRDLLYYIRTLDPYNNGIAINTAEIARTLSTNGRNVHRQTISRALKALDQKGFIDMEFITVNVRVQPLGLWYSQAVEGDCTEQTSGCPETPNGIVTHLSGSSDTGGTPSLPHPVRVSPPLNKINKTFSEGERETKVEQLKSDPEVNSKERKQPQTNNFPLPAQESVNSGEKFSAAAAVFEIPAEKKRGFYDAVRQYAADSGVSRPPAYAKKVMADLEQTGMCSLWDDFEAGLELGTSDRPSHEWLDPKSGEPYPFLVRAVEETVRNDPRFNDPVAAATQAAKVISNPKLCQPIWASVKRELLHYHDEAKRMQRLGVRHTYLPPRYSDKPLEPALSEVKDAIASITPSVIKSLEKSQTTPTPEAKSREKSQTTPTPEAKSREKSDSDRSPQAKSLEKSQTTLTPLAESLKNLDAILGNPLDKPKESPDLYEQRQPVDHKTFEERDRESQERIMRAKNKALRFLTEQQEQQALQEIKGKLSSNPQERQSQLQTWMNGKHPYPAIAKRLIEANQNWGLYLDGTRVLEEEF